jgi:hypothetical protein
LFYAAKWHVFSRQDANVNSHHAVFQGFGHAVNAPYIAAVKITGEAKLGGLKKLTAAAEFKKVSFPE